MPDQSQVRFSFQSQSATEKGYEILFIQEGEANGWTFPASVLQESVKLWEETNVFVDHSFWGRSVRELGGVLSAVAWSEDHQGLTAKLSLSGPSREIVREAGQVMLGEGAKPNLGFSADVIFTADSKGRVEKIIKPVSVDLVINPAFATKFIRQLNSRASELQANIAHPDARASGKGETMQTDNKPTMDDITAQLEATKAAHLATLENLLDQSLLTADLPEAAEKDLRTRFASKEFKPEELKTAIEGYLSLAQASEAGLSIDGPGRVSHLQTGGESFEAACYDLLGAKRPEALKKAKPAPLSGIREMYPLATGDVFFHGGSDQNRMRVKFETTADLANLLADIQNKIVSDHWNVLAGAGYEWWKPIVNIEQVNNMQDLKGIIISQVDVLPSVAEGASYTELAIDDNKETASFTKYGAYLGLTLEMFLKDETRKMRAIPRIMANSGIRTLSKEISDVFTDNSGVGPTMADTKALFHADHNNLGTTALSASEWEVASTAIYEQSMLAPAGDDGGVLGVDAKYLLVPRELKLTAMQILYPSLERTANIYSENLQRGEPGDVIVVPHWTDANNWAAVADPRVAPAITVGHIFGIQPEIYIARNATDYAVFDADESRIKVRQIFSILVSDYRPVYKENVA